MEDPPLELIDAEGETHAFTPDRDEGYVESFGRMITKEVQAALDEGTFSKLPLADGCRISIEEINGTDDWPKSEEPASLANSRSRTADRSRHVSTGQRPPQRAGATSGRPG